MSLLSVVSVVILGSMAPRSVTASGLLENGEFAQAPPTGWAGATASATLDSTAGQSGSSWRVAMAGGARVFSQTVQLTGATADASYYAATDVELDARLTLTFLDAGFAPLDHVQHAADVSASEGFVRISISTSVPQNTEWVSFTVTLTSAAAGQAWIDSASLTGSGAPVPTATPTHTPVPTATPATPSPTPTRTATTPAGTATAKPSATATKTTTGATPTKTPTPMATPKPTLAGGGGGTTGGGGSTNSPPGGGSAPVVEPPPTGSDSPDLGGLLRNGGFERVADGVPADWAKYGGEVFSVAGGRSGNLAASLQSLTDSTKWLHQVVPVQAGTWFEFTAWAKRESGTGEAFLRLSFYASPDGSGSTFEQADSTTVVTAGSWTFLTTGPVQAPAGARSVRARLMVRPAGPYSAAFDDASLVVTSAPAATAVPPATLAPSKATPTPTKRATNTPAAGATRTPTRVAGGSRTGSAPVVAVGQLSSAIHINEILYDGDGDPDHAYEWVELHNTGAESVALAGWSIADANSADALPSIDLPAGGFVVVVSSDFAGDVPNVARLSNNRIGSGLNNDGDTVVLTAPDGSIADEVTYGGGDAVASGAGTTVGRNSDGQWFATLRPTPGEPNLFPESVAEPTPTAPGTPGPSSTSRPSSTPTPGQDDADAVGPTEASGGSSPVPWLVLGGAAGVGALASFNIGKKKAQSLLERRRAR